MAYENTGSEEPSNLEVSEVSEAYFLSFDELELEEIFKITEMFDDYSEQNNEYEPWQNPDLVDYLTGMLEETNSRGLDVVQAYSFDGETYNFFSTVSEEGLYIIGDGSIEETFQSIYEMAERRFV